MKILKLGDKGALVKLWQEFLIQQGHLQTTTFGNFLGKTEAATKQFQQKHSIAQSGVANQVTVAMAVSLGFQAPEEINPTFGVLTDITPSEQKTLTDTDIITAATSLGISPASMKAVATVEAGGRGFLSDGRAKILFEGHIFWKQLIAYGINPKPLAPLHKTVLYEKWTKKYYKGGVAEYERLDEAAGIHSDAAHNSASWGMFQIMGFHWKTLGYSSVSAFVRSQQKSEAEHLKAFCEFIKTHNLTLALQNKDWAKFALRYNGAGYALNQYDVKLEAAYLKAVNDGFAA
ncbi:MAG: N-acetylmuramidase family protein [Bacteroidetes bacterium]|nr:N-acetylmuramidase family protein [Bacteroidota bacterium]